MVLAPVDIRCRALVIVLAAAAPADTRASEPDDATARVLQVTAAAAYVSLGARDGLKVGDQITLRLVDRSQAKARVLDVWGAGARVELPAGRPLPALGSPVEVPTALRAPRPAPRRQLRVLPAPEPTGVVEGRWRTVKLARRALVPTPRAAPQKAPREPARPRGTLALEYLGLFDLDGQRDAYQQLGLSSSLDLPSLLGGWLSYSHRLRLTFDVVRDLDARPFSDSRPNLRVYRLRAAISRSIVRGELGRMIGGPLPSAALIDGGSVRLRVADSVYIGAFGGLQASPLSLEPSTDASRFGVYASFRLHPARSWSVAFDLGVIGSTWQGDLDRKALAARLALRAGKLALHAQAVVDAYGPSDHPADRPSVEPSLLLAELDYSPARWLSIDLRVDHYRFVASRQAIALFPAGYTEAEGMLGLRSAVTLRPSERLDISAEVGWERQDEDRALWVEGALGLRALLGDEDRLSLSWLSSSSSVFDHGARLSYARPLAAWLWARAAYRLSRYGYASEVDDEQGWRHELALSAELTIGRRWSLALDAQAHLADTEHLLLALGTLAFHF